MERLSVEEAGAPLLPQAGKAAAAITFVKAKKILVLVLFLLVGTLVFVGVGFGISLLTTDKTEPTDTRGGGTAEDDGSTKPDDKREDVKPCAWKEYRLPGWVKPNDYSLELDVQMVEPYSVVGSVEIGVDVVESTHCVVLHADEMTVGSVILKETGEQGNVTQQPFQQVVVEFGSNLPEPSATLVFAFNYTLNQGMKGFYKSFYEDDEGAQSFASTQFETLDARLALPCFDEPALKAPMTLTLVVPINMSCLSNMPEASVETLSKGKDKHTFETSPAMSTYLFAWAVGRMVSVGKDVETMGGTKRFSVWGTPHRVNELQHALEFASKIIPYYERLLNIPYALPKLDLIAIPNFAAGAMENWGMITYRETSLLLSDTESSSEQWTWVASVIAHETAHLWFGDLVTMSWWGDIWLNEGFATYMEFLGVEKALPSAHQFQRFFLEEDADAFGNDESKAAHPLSVPEEDTVVEGRLRNYFDGISYDKGASVLRMLHTYLNRTRPAPSVDVRKVLEGKQSVNENDHFLNALESYLGLHKFANTDTADLWKAMEASTRLHLTDLMHKWSYEPGYPVVFVELDGKGATVRQEPFGKANCTEGDEWWIPIQYTTMEDPSPRWHVLDTCGPAALTRLADDHDFPIINKDRVGYYRVVYSSELMNRLLWKIPNQDSPFGGVDLAGLLSDAYHMESDDGDIELLLNLTRYFGVRKDKTYSPWSVALGGLFKIQKMINLKDPECAEKLGNYVVAEVTGNIVPVIVPQKTSVNATEGKDFDYGMMRGLVLYEAGIFGDQRVIQAALSAVNSNETIDADLRKAYYSMAVAHGDAVMYEKMKSMYLNATQVHEKKRLMHALGWGLDPELVNRTLNLAISEDVKSQDTRQLISYVASRTKQSAELAFAFVKENFGAILDKLGGESSAQSVGRLISSIAGNFASDDKVKEVEDLFTLHDDVLFEIPYLAKAREQIKKNQQWIEKYADKTCNWLPE